MELEVVSNLIRHSTYVLRVDLAASKHLKLHRAHEVHTDVGDEIAARSCEASVDCARRKVRLHTRREDATERVRCGIALALVLRAGEL